VNNVPEWKRYGCSITEGDSTQWETSDGTRLDKVYHIAHVAYACRIIEDGCIKAGLIGDESHLKHTRTNARLLQRAGFFSQG
jgi:hypothetical protein